MLDILREQWDDLGATILRYYYSVKFFLLTMQYVMATGDVETLENLYVNDSDAV